MSWDEAVRRALAVGHLGDDAPSAILFDLDAYEARIGELQRAFGDPAGGTPAATGPGSAATGRVLHTLAVKALPLPPILRLALDRGLGLEVASEGEVALAEHVGAPPDRVVFDSPAKTPAEIRHALARGYRLNVDNLQELERVVEARPPRGGGVGLRLNPEVGGARIAGTFTAGRGAKFGIPLSSQEGEVRAAWALHAWLDGLHVHVGSQGCAIDVLVRGIERVVAFARSLPRPPAVLDIGGGLPVAYRPEDVAPSFADYAAALGSLLDGPWTVTTEMGRSLLAPCAVAVSRVEYTRPGRMAVTHLGADLFVRAVYRPEEWFHRVTVLGPDGLPKEGAPEPWTIAGPLCFSGDLVARERPLPPIAPGDWVVVHDAGAYTLSMWSRYNSRPAPAVVGVRALEPLSVLKRRETTADVLRFWSP